MSNDTIQIYTPRSKITQAPAAGAELAILREEFDRRNGNYCCRSFPDSLPPSLPSVHVSENAVKGATVQRCTQLVQSTQIFVSTEPTDFVVLYYGTRVLHHKLSMNITCGTAGLRQDKSIDTLSGLGQPLPPAFPSRSQTTRRDDSLSVLDAHHTSLASIYPTPRVPAPYLWGISRKRFPSSSTRLLVD